MLLFGNFGRTFVLGGKSARRGGGRSVKRLTVRGIGEPAEDSGCFKC